MKAKTFQNLSGNDVDNSHHYRFRQYSVSAKVTVLYTPPFEDHDRWYTGLEAMPLTGLCMGILNSANAYLNMDYKDGVAYISSKANRLQTKLSG